MLVVLPVQQKTSGNDVMIGDISLHFGQIAATPDSVTVRSRRELRLHYVVIFSVQSVKKPQSPFNYRARHCEPGIDFIECPSFFILERRDKIGDRVTKMVVAYACLD